VILNQLRSRCIYMYENLMKFCFRLVHFHRFESHVSCTCNLVLFIFGKLSLLLHLISCVLCGDGFLSLHVSS
jgi:hypothetical protein